MDEITLTFLSYMCQNKAPQLYVPTTNSWLMDGHHLCYITKLEKKKKNIGSWGNKHIQ
jgi:hypothetical protein